jgi:hypothetical protein
MFTFLSHLNPTNSKSQADIDDISLDSLDESEVSASGAGFDDDVYDGDDVGVDHV